jgi:hypothetical protein
MTDKTQPDLLPQSRYIVENENMDICSVYDTVTDSHICTVETGNADIFTTTADMQQRAQAIADALNASGFDYEPMMEPSNVQH